VRSVCAVSKTIGVHTKIISASITIVTINTVYDLACSTHTLLWVARSAEGARNNWVLACGDSSNNGARVSSASVSIITVLGQNITVSSGNIALLRIAKVGVIARVGGMVAHCGSETAVVASINSARVVVITTYGLGNTLVIHTSHRVARISPCAGEAIASKAISSEIGVNTSSTAGVARIQSARVVIVTSLVGKHATRRRSARIISASIVVITSDGNVVAISGRGGTSIVGASVSIIARNWINDGTVSGCGVTLYRETKVSTLGRASLESTVGI